VRDAAGRFVKGCSGNPAGRPRGSRNAATVMAEALLAENAVEVVQDLLARHRAGDAVTGRFLGGRVLPPARGRPVALELAPGAARRIRRRSLPRRCARSPSARRRCCPSRTERYSWARNRRTASLSSGCNQTLGTLTTRATVKTTYPLSIRSGSSIYRRPVPVAVLRRLSSGLLRSRPIWPSTAGMYAAIYTAAPCVDAPADSGRAHYRFVMLEPRNERPSQGCWCEAVEAAVRVSLATVYNTLHQFHRGRAAARGGGEFRPLLFRHQLSTPTSVTIPAGCSTFRASMSPSPACRSRPRAPHPPHRRDHPRRPGPGSGRRLEIF
jgi:hypothetical protein